MKFSGHGTLKFWVEGNILMLQGEGPWNKEFVLIADEGALESKEALHGKPWAVYAEFTGLPICVPDAKEELVEQIKIDIEKGRIATAVLLKDCQQPEFCQEYLSQLYQECGDNFCFFDNKQQAMAWLQSQFEKIP